MDDHLSALTRGRYISLTTYRRDGRPVATPVWFAVDGHRMLVWTDMASGKAKRVRLNGRATVAPSDARGKITGPTFDMYARVLPADEFDASNRILRRKYRLLKPLVDAWTGVTHALRRKPRPVEGYIELRRSDDAGVSR